MNVYDYFFHCEKEMLNKVTPLIKTKFYKTIFKKNYFKCRKPLWLLALSGNSKKAPHFRVATDKIVSLIL